MTRKVLVGALLLGALFVFGLATFYVKNWQYYLGRGYLLTAKFPVVHTLDEGDVVRMAGVPVGTVARLTIDTEEATREPVTARLRIQQEVKVRAQDTAIIRLTSVFGGSYVGIQRGDPEARVLTDGEQIPRTRVAPSVTEIIEQSKKTLAEVNTAFEDVTSITADLREGKGALGRLLQDEELRVRVGTISEDAAEAVRGLKKAAARLEQGEGVLGKLVMDETMASQVEAFVADARELTEDLRTIAENLRSGEGTFGKLLTEEELYEKLSSSIDTLSEVGRLMKEGEGVVSKLINDPEMAEEIRTLVTEAREAATNLREVSAKVREGENTIGRLLDNDEAYRKLDASLEDLNEFTAALTKGEGTISKLVTRDEAYNKLTKLVDSVQSIVDTYREQSPVVSFAGAIFGAF